MNTSCSPCKIPGRPADSVPLTLPPSRAQCKDRSASLRTGAPGLTGLRGRPPPRAEFSAETERLSQRSKMRRPEPGVTARYTSRERRLASGCCHSTCENTDSDSKPARLVFCHLPPKASWRGGEKQSACRLDPREGAAGIPTGLLMSPYNKLAESWGRGGCWPLDSKPVIPSHRGEGHHLPNYPQARSQF
ncbi:uncharacterized protein LOC120617209 [Pteropus medius]|uniref:uncharacterized protein LOC120617209 n=1 Tax=Pteropus vampyrus TaxID=132908 RepID=UPI00196AA284|nr:uncharacterized protein LOC120617209 [Pteropus giganteus]